MKTTTEIREMMEQGRWADALYALIDRVEHHEDELVALRKDQETNRPNPMFNLIGACGPAIPGGTRQHHTHTHPWERHGDYDG